MGKISLNGKVLSSVDAFKEIRRLQNNIADAENRRKLDVKELNCLCEQFIEAVGPTFVIEGIAWRIENVSNVPPQPQDREWRLNVDVSYAPIG
jgi:hypothetical protein